MILVGQWLGQCWATHTANSSLQAERLNGIRIHTELLCEAGDWQQLEQFFTKAAEATDTFKSLALRDEHGRLLAATPGHRKLWKSSEAVSMRLPIQSEKLAYLECCLPRETTKSYIAAVEHWVSQVSFLGGCISLLIAFYFYRSGRHLDGSLVPERVRHALDTLAEGLLVLDEQERIVLANRAFSETCGLPQEQLIGRTASSLAWRQTEATARGDFPWIRALIDNRQQVDQQLQYESSAGVQRVFSVNSAPIGNRNGKKHGAMATFRDITEMEEHRSQLENMLVMLQSSRDEISRKNRELEVLATQDGLTGCLNRRAFFDRFARAWEHAVSHDQPLACVMVDNDHFKNVNDTYGHHIGDEVLRSVAATLRQLYPSPTLVCRYGGEEFCLLLPGKSMEQATVMAEAVRQAIEAIRLNDPSELRLTASVGVSTLGLGANEPQELINQADKCLYLAKRTGRNRVVSYRTEMAELEIDDAKISRSKPVAEVESQSIPYPAVSALLSALSYRDAETAEHSRRVADLVVLAVDGILSHRDTYILEIAALLHDVGKVGVPDHLLLKSGPLTEEEWEVMRRHQRIGTEMVASTFNNRNLEAVIRNYRVPFAKDTMSTTDANPSQRLSWRLLAIADSFDSMTTDHVYRQGLSYEEAFAELRSCAGKQFDPKLVEHFISRVNEQSHRGLFASPKMVSPQTAIQLGLQLERLADALDNQDISGLAALASRVKDTATHADLQDIAAAAMKLETCAAKESSDLVQIVELTTELLQLCRSTQSQVAV